MKSFRVHAGTTLNDMTEVVYDSLKNDDLPEEFEFKQSNGAPLLYPVQYIKIEPLS